MLEAPFHIRSTALLDRIEGQTTPYMAVEDVDDDEPETWQRSFQRLYQRSLPRSPAVSPS